MDTTIARAHQDSVAGALGTASTLVPQTPSALEPGRVAVADAQVRDLALDFTKGILVLSMVVYHWINYFVTREGFVYRYLRFVTPSFIFLTGFLVTSVYVAKCARNHRETQKRLAERGLKLIVLFTLLNVGAHTILSRNYNGSSLGLGEFFRNIFPIYVTGDGRGAAFEVLVPIGYLLLLSALLLSAGRWRKLAFELACAFALLCAFFVAIKGHPIPNLELVAIGLVGALAGYVPRLVVDRMTAHMPEVVLAYALYVGAVTYWNATYVLQVFGVCLSVLLVYLAGTRTVAKGAIYTPIVMLGRYSLLSYIAQIVILQLLLRVLAFMSPGMGRLVASAVATLILTMATALLAERWRQSSTLFDRLYRMVFA